MKKILLSFLLLFTISFSYAAHIIGGELRYEIIGPGTQPNTRLYKIILLLVKGDATGPNVADLGPSYVVGIFNNDNNVKVPGTTTFQDWLISMDNPPGILPVPILASSCLTNPPNLNYTYATYSMTVELPINASGYTVVHQTCCRQLNMANVSAGTDATGASYTCVIPGTQQLNGNVITDNGPQFQLPVSVICFESPFTLDFSATDVDGDSLVYSFCNAYDGGLATNSGFEDPAAPPYASVNYINGFTATTPLGNLATINPQTGIISGIAPAEGNYVVCVCVRAYKNGRLVTTHRKDLLVKVSPCIPIEAVAMPDFTTCDGFNVQFSHNSLGANTVFWDFGDPSTLADTSIAGSPVYIYPDTGVYTVKFIINKGEDCSDSAFTTVRVYPGFFPGFVANAPFCAGQPVQFSDTTLTNYGVVDSWSWDFGNTTSSTDISQDQNPQYVYTNAGNYDVTLIVSNSKGCVDTVITNIDVLATPAIAVTPGDTTYCGLDSLRLTATGTGNISWSPNTNIIGANTANPIVFPNTITTYTATINVAGCRNTDTIRLTPLFDLSNNITANPLSICQEDTLTLTGSSNRTSHLSWKWSPTASVASPNSRITRAYPNITTTYTLQTTWGTNCVTQSSIQIPVTPLAIANAGPDKNFCIGQQAVQLQASGGVSYSWSPATGLSNPNISNPTAAPLVNTNYVVSVGVAGCSRTRKDTVRVFARPKPPLGLTNDTTICIVDGLQLNATGTGSFSWSPNYNISAVTGNAPFATPDTFTVYHVQLTDSIGCISKDSVKVTVKRKTIIDAGADTSICKSEGFRINTTGDALHYAWSPSTYLNNDSIKNPFVRPLVTTTYQVIGNIGTCSDTADITIKVAPYPPANAGNDTTLCIGFSGRLQASGGSSYTWSPPTFLNNPSISNPQVVLPTGDMIYIVTVTDTLGCTKPITDTVKVIVIPELNVYGGKDTTIVTGQPLPLRATGALNYSWSWDPPTLPGWLNATNVSSPLATPEQTIQYIVQGTDKNGCKATDSIVVTVYDVDPDMYVPSAFSPNGDGKNDIFRPILLGMKSLNYFRIYNRWGQLVYESSSKTGGWNGMYAGKPQDPGGFVWMAQGVTYKNELKTKKGNFVLIR